VTFATSEVGVEALGPRLGHYSGEWKPPELQRTLVFSLNQRFDFRIRDGLTFIFGDNHD